MENRNMKRIVALILISLFTILAFISCTQEPIVPEEKTPTIRGSVSIPESSGLTGSDFFVRIMEGETAVFTGRVKEDGSFAVSGLSEEASYSILLTTEEPGDITPPRRTYPKLSTPAATADGSVMW